MRVVTGSLGGAIAIGAGAAAVGSVVSQGLAVATGIQEKFSWKGVALSALSGGVGAGLGGVGGNGIAGGVLRGALGSVATQGIAAATGLQKSFDWVGVAAAGIGGGVGAAAGNAIGDRLGGFGGSLAASGASAIANAATRSAIEGSGFGDNIRAAIPDVIGQALGNAVARGIASASAGRSAAIQRAAGDPKQGSGGRTLLDNYVLDLPSSLSDTSFVPGFDPELAASLASIDAEMAFQSSREARIALGIGVGVASGSLVNVPSYGTVAGGPAAGLEVLPFFLNNIGEASFPGFFHQPDAGYTYFGADGLDPARYGAYADQLITESASRYQLERVILPALDQYAGDARFGMGWGVARDRVTSYLAGFAATDAIADRAVWDVVKAAIPPLDTATAAYRVGINNEYTWENGLTLGASVLGGLGTVAKFGFRGGASVVGKSNIPRIGGRLPINYKYAGQVHPSGVRFTEQGFPNFGPYAKAQIGVEGLTGVYRADAALANAAVGLKSTPPGFVWHHVEDAHTMQLIPRSIHESVKHTGGVAVIKNGGFD